MIKHSTSFLVDVVDETGRARGADDDLDNACLGL